MSFPPGFPFGGMFSFGMHPVQETKRMEYLLGEYRTDDPLSSERMAGMVADGWGIHTVQFVPVWNKEPTEMLPEFAIAYVMWGRTRITYSEPDDQDDQDASPEPLPPPIPPTRYDPWPG